MKNITRSSLSQLVAVIQRLIDIQGVGASPISAYPRLIQLIPVLPKSRLARQTDCNGLIDPIDPKKIKVNQGGSSSIKVNQGILKHFYFMQNQETIRSMRSFDLDSTIAQYSSLDGTRCQGRRHSVVY